MSKPNGLICYDGPSLIDGKPIVLIVTGIARKSKNSKLGQMLQTWILRKDISPTKAYTTGEDFSICGDCRHRLWGTCYVTIWRSPWNVWQAYKRGSYAPLNYQNMHLLNNKKMRVGSYGEPAAIPFEVWQKLLASGGGLTGYTHAWKRCDQRLKQICMASVEMKHEAEKAQKMGWRYFRAILPGDNPSKNEFICPASERGGKKTTCEKCGSCAGTSSKVTKCPLIVIHGQNNVIVHKYMKIQKLRKNHEPYIKILGPLYRRKIAKSARQRFLAKVRA
jgi:hypothetical protein